MPSIKEISQIVKMTPAEQAIMLKGRHGIGKSEIIKSIFEKSGYRVIILFVGQMADAGDFIGLPDRESIRVQWTDDKGETVEEMTKITDFCPPKWWPYNPNEKVVIFLDEANRGKPEIQQCLMDMVLNRRLNGRALPKMTRIIAAINPGDDGYYQVEDLDPAFLDRFNVYDFLPTVEEWIYYAASSNYNKSVVNFISKNDTFLDPPKSSGDGAEAKMGEVYPSRRSWERVSKFMNKNPNIDENLLKTYLIGVIGFGATSSFVNFLKTVDKGLNPGRVISDWDDEIEKIIRGYNIGQVIFLNESICRWFNENIEMMKAAPDMTKKFVKNLTKYLETINPDTMAQFWTSASQSMREGQEWPEILIDADPTESLSKKYLEVLHGETEDELEWE